MSKIRVLSDQVANQIAAGEVVERPASVVKELLENALDAGAGSIEVEIERGGKSLIRIRDNGEGMTRDDALMAFERHATSKIRSVEDLNSIQTFGFRGEALAAIASVARITLTSKLQNEIAGTEIDIEGGRIISVKDAAWPGGTEIIIRNLFFNVPARRKFLKSETTESYHVTNLITHYSLANHSYSFSLKNNKREVIRVTPTENLRDRAYQILGESLLEELLEVSYTRDEIAVKGFVSKPQRQRASRDGQYLFVNGRFVKDRLLSRAVTDAYKNVIPPGTFPSVVLFVEVPTEVVDVNVHPQKTEVRFRDAQSVLSVVCDGIRQSLRVEKSFANFPVKYSSDLEKTISNTTLVQPIEGGTVGESTVQEISTNALGDLPKASESSSQDYKTINRQVSENNYLAENPVTTDGIKSPNKFIQPPKFFTQEHSSQFNSDRHLSNLFSSDSGARTGRSMCSTNYLRRNNQLVSREQIKTFSDDIRILGQLHNSYIVGVDSQGLLLIDQHVAHERILFEKHLRRLMGNDVTSQVLLLSEVMDLTPAQAIAFEQRSDDLKASGFDATHIAGRTIALRAIPVELSTEEARALFIELLEIVEKERITLEDFRREIAAGLACRAAIKVNQELTVEKMNWLLQELFVTEHPTNCPHGRPVLLRFDMHEIERGFKRI